VVLSSAPYLHKFFFPLPQRSKISYSLITAGCRDCCSRYASVIAMNVVD
jgi:hypothetical protein